MKQPFRREYPSTVAGLNAYYKAKDNWNKKQREEKKRQLKENHLEEIFRAL